MAEASKPNPEKKKTSRFLKLALAIGALALGIDLLGH